MATKALVSSSPLRGCAITRGVWSNRNQRRNITPRSAEAKRERMCVAMHGHPRGDQVGNERRIEKMLNAENDHGEREDVASDYGKNGIG